MSILIANNRNRLNYSQALFYGLTLFLFGVAAYNFIRMPSLGLTTDEHIHYMAMTKMLASGSKLYQTYVDHQPPGVFISGVPFIWLFGNTVLTAKLETMTYTALYIIA